MAKGESEMNREQFEEKNEVMRLGDPLPDWFMAGVISNHIILHKCEPINGPWDHSGETTAFIWTGKSIQIVHEGELIADTGNGTYKIVNDQP